MTEQEMPAGTVRVKMLECRIGSMSPRKLGLFAVACWRLVPAEFVRQWDERLAGLEVLERDADGRATRAGLHRQRP
jgi:hypothetical protein